MMKGLPSGYNRDFHEDKEILVESLDIINSATSFLPELISSTHLNFERMKELTYLNFCTATEVANYLVMKHNVAFRQAHHIVGSLVGELVRSNRNFRDWEACVDWIIKKNNIKANPEELKKVFDPVAVMLSYNTLGGTGKEATEQMLKEFHTQLTEHNKVIAKDKARLDEALETTRTIASKAASVTSAKQLADLIPAKYKA